jgi:hypothetical protein
LVTGESSSPASLAWTRTICFDTLTVTETVRTPSGMRTSSISLSSMPKP